MLPNDSNTGSIKLEDI